MPDLRGRTVLVTGASRGIGRAIALRCARDGASVAVAAKSSQPHPRLPGTIHSVAEEVEQAGGSALAVRLDVRDEESVAAAVARTVETFGRIDALVNNAGYISLTGTRDTALKRFDLMMAINVRAAFACTRAVLPHLSRAGGGHVLNLSPPIRLEPRWLAPHAAYSVSKYGMSLLTIGMAAELAEESVAVNSLWPRTTIATAAIEVHFPAEILRASRRPEIVADAAHAILSDRPHRRTGQLLLDEDVLREQGVTDFDPYAVEPGTPLMPDLYVGDPVPRAGG
jgi:citronellol/citronellal dehydrogenase